MPRLQGLRFDAVVCRGCAQCVATAGSGKTVQLHPQEALLEQCETLAKTGSATEVVQHWLARQVPLGIHQSRCFRHI